MEHRHIEGSVGLTGPQRRGGSYKGEDVMGEDGENADSSLRRGRAGRRVGAIGGFAPQAGAVKGLSG